MWRWYGRAGTSVADFTRQLVLVAFGLAPYLAIGVLWFFGVFWLADVLMSHGWTPAWAHTIAYGWPAIVLSPFIIWLLIMAARANPPAKHRPDANAPPPAE